MWKRLADFLRRNLLIILFAVLILSQILTWRAVVAIGEGVKSLDYYACGTDTHPCRVRMVPDR
jgi:hypothetical protein